MKTIGEAVQFLYRLRHSGVKMGLKNMQRLCAVYGDPQTSSPVIHVAGTNGKGSVVAMLESILIHAGFRCAAFTSPHLIRFNERFRINGKPVTDEVLLRHVRELKNHLDILKAEEAAGETYEPTFFEATNAMAFSLFRESQVEVTLIETGLGGRLDSTNVVDPVVSVITSIGMDHQELLGDTIEQIAAEKAGIIKRGKPVVVGELSASCLQVIRDKAESCSSPLHLAEQWRPVSVDAKSLTRRVEGVGRHWDLGLAGQAQAGNAAVAYETIQILRKSGWNIDEQVVVDGLRQTAWPARFQRICCEPEIILDGAHNSDAVDDLCRTWFDFFGEAPDLIAVGCLKNKLTPAMAHSLRALCSDCERVLVVPVADERSASCQEMAAALSLESCCCEEVLSVEQLLREMKSSRPDAKHLICGSLYLAGEVLAQLQAGAFQPELNG